MASCSARRSSPTAATKPPCARELPAKVWQEQDGRRIKATGGKQLTYQQCPDAMARCKMVRTDEWKLVVRETGDHELYNMRQDPEEMHNRYGEETLKPVVADLQMQLLQWCMRTDTDRPYLSTFGA
jgi:arylsulfatase A-like enzyme